MAGAAAFQGAGSGGRARFGVERRGEEREREVARQNGEKRAAEGSSAGEELRAAHWRGRRLVASSASRSAGTRAWHSEGRRALERGAGSTTGTGAGWRGRRRGSNGAAALVARVPCGRAAASGVQARAHSSGARQCGAAGQRARQRRSEPAAAVQRAHARPRSSVCARAEREGPAGKRERREKESGERKPKVNRLT